MPALSHPSRKLKLKDTEDHEAEEGGEISKLSSSGNEADAERKQYEQQEQYFLLVFKLSSTQKNQRKLRKRATAAYKEAGLVCAHSKCRKQCFK